MTPPKPATTNAVIIERVDNLKEDVSKLDYKVDKLIEMVSVAKDADTRARRNEAEIAQLIKSVSELRDVVIDNKNSIDRFKSLNKWVIGIGTTLLVALILATVGAVWGLLNHDIAVIKILPTAIPTIITTIMP